MDYSAIALAAAVMTARKVMDHEEQIAAIMRRLSDVEAENAAEQRHQFLLYQQEMRLQDAEMPRLNDTEHLRHRPGRSSRMRSVRSNPSCTTCRPA